MRSQVWLSLLLVVSCLGAAGATDGDALPDPATLEAKVAALAQAAPPNFRETIVSHSSDGEVGYVTYHRFDDARSVTGPGALQEQSGIFEHEQWRHDANGVTVVADDPPADPTVLTVTREDGPPAMFVLSRLTKRGFGTRTYVDATTLRTLKTEGTDPNESTTTTYTSYATFGGYTMPATWTVTSNAAGPMTTTLYTRKDVVLGGVSADDVAEPPTRDIVTFPAGVTRVDLPATFTNGYAILHGKAGGQDASFMLDSGSAVITISPALAHRLGVVPVTTIALHGAGAVSVKEAIIPTLQIGPLTLHDVAVSIVPVGSYGFNNEDFGVIGFDFLATLAVTIDYLHQRVTAESGWNYQAPADRSTFAVPVRLGDMVPTVEAVINGARSNRLIFDSGAMATLFLFRYFSGAHPEIFDQPTFDDIIVSGVGGGNITPQAFFFRTIKLGRLTLEHFTGYRIPLDSRAFNMEADGLFGAGFLRHFTVIFDYVHGQILLQQNHDGGLLPVGR